MNCFNNLNDTFNLNTLTNKDINMCNNQFFNNNDPIGQGSKYLTSPNKNKKNNNINIAESEIKSLIYCDSEVNNLPKELLKIDTDSPKDKDNDMRDNFNIQYKNVFDNKKQNWEEKEYGNLSSDLNNYISNSNNPQQNKRQFYFAPPNDSPTIDNEGLIKQYQNLEEIFQKVYEVSNLKTKLYYASKIKTNLISLFYYFRSK